MRYEGTIYRPPSEADAYILQATIGCSWNHCTYCGMYRDKAFAVRPLADCLEDIDRAAHYLGSSVEKVFIADGDALVMPMSHWLPILERCRLRLPRLRRVSCYAMARNVLDKSEAELEALHAAGLQLLYVGPESGDDETLRRIAKGDGAAAHVEAAGKAKRAGMELSVILLLGIAGKRWREHAEASAALATQMDPTYLSALTVAVVPDTPLGRLAERGDFELPAVSQLLDELRILVDQTRPTSAIFRTNHASNHLLIGGRLPDERERLLQEIDAARNGQVRLRPARSRRL